MKAIVLRACAAGLLRRLIYGVVEFILACGLEIFSNAVDMFRWVLPMIGFLFGPFASCGVCLAKINKGHSMGRHEYVVAWAAPRGVAQ